MKFSEDIFKRKAIAEYIVQIVRKKDEIFGGGQALVMGIDSPWGTGKSTFLEMWETDLKENKKDEFQVLVYNAWQDDDYDDPLVPIGLKIAEACSEDKKRKIVNLLKEISKKAALNILSGYADSVIGEKGTKEISKLYKQLTGEETRELIMESAVTLETGFEEDFRSFKETKENLRAIFEKITEKKKIIFIIDELDRCRPLYAIKTLEVVKHYFDIEGLNFIFALDMEQLKHSIATIYGQNMDAYGYLRRFFQYCMRLPRPNLKDYMRFIGLDNMTGNPEAFKHYFHDMSFIFEELRLTFRDVDVIYHNIRILYILKIKTGAEIGDQDMKRILFYSYLTAIKYKNPNGYDKLIHEYVDTDQNGVCGRGNKEIGDRQDFAYSIKVVQDYFNALKHAKNQQTIEEYREDTWQQNFFESYIKIPGCDYTENDTISSYIEHVLEESI